MVANELPFQLFGCAGIIVVNIFVVFARVVLFHETFEQRFGKFEFACLFECVNTQILKELIVCVGGLSLVVFFANFLTEFFLIFHSIFSESIVKEFLIQLGRFAVIDFSNGVCEVSFVILQLFFLYFEHGSRLSFVAIKRSGLDCENVVFLCAVKDFLLFFVFNVFR